MRREEPNGLGDAWQKPHPGAIPAPAQSIHEPKAPASAHSAVNIAPLTSARFIAALLVVLYHTSPRSAGGGVISELSAKLIDLGFAAVGFFFVLSGFILAIVYPAALKGPALLRFWVARLARIYPLYALSLAVDVPRLLAWRVAKMGFGTGIAAVAATLTAQLGFLQVWLPGTGGLNHPSWSVATEAYFYLAFPLLLPLLGAMRGFRANLGMMLVLIGLIGAIAVGVHALSLPRASVVETLAGHSPITRLPEFALGIVLANIRGHLQATGRRLHAGEALLVLGLIGFVAIVAVSRSIPTSLLQSATLMPFNAAVILGLATTGGAIRRLLSWTPLVLLGEASYALYLLHVPVWNGFVALGGDQSSSAYLAYLGAAVAVSVIAHLLVEAPARRAIVAYWDRMPRAN